MSTPRPFVDADTAFGVHFTHVPHPQGHTALAVRKVAPTRRRLAHNVDLLQRLVERMLVLSRFDTDQTAFQFETFAAAELAVGEGGLFVQQVEDAAAVV